MIIRALALATACFFSGSAIAEEPEGRWAFIGVDQFGSGTKYYIIFDEIEELEKGVFLVPSLAVAGVTQAGIDFPDGSGGLYTNTDYPYRSIFERRVIDCNQGLAATFETHYYLTVSPSKQSWVYTESVGSPLLYPTIPYDVVFTKVCGS